MKDNGVIMCDGKLRVFRDGTVHRIVNGVEKIATQSRSTMGRHQSIEKLVVSYKNNRGLHTYVPVAKLVIMAYIEPNYEKLTGFRRKIIYKDGNYTNCSVDNLKLPTDNDMQELYANRLKYYERCSECNGLLISKKYKLCAKCRVKHKSQLEVYNNKRQKLEKIEQELKHIRFDILSDKSKQIVANRRCGLLFKDIGKLIGTSSSNASTTYKNIIKRDGTIFKRSVILTVADSYDYFINFVPAEYGITMNDLRDYGEGTQTAYNIARKHKLSTKLVNQVIESIVDYYVQTSIA